MKHLVLIIGFIFTALNNNAQTELWGMTSFGGQHNSGVIYKTDTAGNQTIEYNFFVLEGENPVYANLTEAPDGKLYGMTQAGGLSSYGVIFQYDPITNIYTKKIDFDSYNCNSPSGSLVLAANGMFYGMVFSGGVNGLGAIFQYDPVTNTFTTKFDFNGSINGSYPYGSLMQATDGNLYGITSGGGTNGFGVLFQYNPISDVFTKKLDFDGLNYGRNARGTLMQASNGMLYGLTYQGGINDLGILFQYDPINDIFTKKLDFDGAIMGSNPHSTSLIQANDGKLYGLTHHGGSNLMGVLFQYDFVSDIYTKKVDFDGAIKGRNPQGTLLQGTDGNLYGLTVNGGVNNLGVLFQFSPSSSIYSKKLDFDGANGGNPSGSLMLASDGNFYGLADNGGLNSKGTLYQYNYISDTFIKKHDFASAINGSSPWGALTPFFNGKLYGITNSGGVYGDGVLFNYDPLTHTYTKEIDFNSSTNGRFPISQLLLASDNKLYGVTNKGGIYNSGILYQFDPASSILSKKFDFNGTTDGNDPYGNLIQASDGNLYGITYTGGINNKGVIFKYDVNTNLFTKKIDLSSSTGGNPQGHLTEFTNGKMYGLTITGGTNSMGTLFEYDPIVNTCLKKVDLSGLANGNNARSNLIITSNGKLFGTTAQGGVNDKGILYEYDVTNNLIIKKLDFSNFNNQFAFGPLYEATDGKLYGTTDFGTTGCGTLYKFDPNIGTYSKKIDFNQTNGCSPYFSHVIEIPVISTKIKQISNLSDFILYPNPNNGLFTIDIKDNSQITITNLLGEVIFNQLIEKGKQNLSIQSQVAGVYFVKVTNTDGISVSKKIIKQ